MGKSHLEFFNQRAREWNKPEDNLKTEKIDDIFYRYNISFTGKILDVGCGTGILISNLIKYGGNSNLIFELDYSREMLRENQHFWKFPEAPVFYINGNAHFLPFPHESLENIVCFAVIPHLSDKQQAFREFHRVLNLSGQLIILHLMGSRQLNQFHSETGTAVKKDRLPSIDVMIRDVQKEGFKVLMAEEREDLYLLKAEK